MSRSKATVRQRTWGSYGHFLNHRQALSHCGGFLYYDTRNADPDIAKTTRIESLDLADDTVRVIYDTYSLSANGPGVGAVVCHPLRSTVLFIHGLAHCNDNYPYSMTRRFGAWASLDPRNPVCKIQALEGRGLQSKLPWGSLGGGTHAHSFSKEGNWVSFTYNDAMQPQRRSVGFAYVDGWDSDHGEKNAESPSKYEDEFQGRGWAALALIPEDPILCAREECWVQGQVDGKAYMALAMIVSVQSSQSLQPPVDEIYLAEFPSDAKRWPNDLSGQMACRSGAGSWRLEPPPGIRWRRLTNTQASEYPGIAGPRHWLIASGCGRWIVALKKDSKGVVRLIRVSVQDGQTEWISGNRQSITHPPAIDPNGGRLTYLVSKRLTILDLYSCQETQVEWDTQGFSEVTGPVQFLPGEQGVFWNARPSGSPWLQIWTASLEPLRR